MIFALPNRCSISKPAGSLAMAVLMTCSNDRPTIAVAAVARATSRPLRRNSGAEAKYVARQELQK